MKINIASILLLSFCITFFWSCKKEWLDAKPEKSLVVPSTIEDYQALLENDLGENGGAGMNANGDILDELAVGDLYLTTANYTARRFIERSTYAWSPEIYGTEANYTEWIYPYRRIFYTNIILEGVDKLKPRNDLELTKINSIKGSAFFLRAFSHYDIAKLFSRPYDKNSSASDLGIPLRLTADFNEVSFRSTIEETYRQILHDLFNARNLLPSTTPDVIANKLHPTKAAADALLARVFLSMGQYDSAFLYSDQCLKAYGGLLDYNNVPITTGRTAFKPFNTEVIFQMDANNWTALNCAIFIVDSTLFKLYENDDLRKSVFFNTTAGVSRFKGSYNGSSSVLFVGLSTDEMYLTRAESNARMGKTPEALADLNALLSKRWKKTVPYPVINISDQATLIDKILTERRKELCFRGIRWQDLRRLNKDPRTAITLNRTINGQNYVLPPNDSKYVFPIPGLVIDLTGMQQNVRQ